MYPGAGFLSTSSAGDAACRVVAASAFCAEARSLAASLFVTFGLLFPAGVLKCVCNVFLQRFPSSRPMALVSEDWWRGESGCPPPTGAAGAQLCWSLL